MRLVDKIASNGYYCPAYELIWPAEDRESFVARLEEFDPSDPPYWLLNVTLMAVQDFLSPEVEIPEGIPKWKKSRLVHRARDRLTAHYWIFSEFDPDEINLAAVCWILGLDVTDVRLRLLVARSEKARMLRSD